VTLDLEAASRTLLGIKEDFDVEAADAHIDLEKGTVVPERAGRRLDLYATAAELERTARAAADRVELAVVDFEPRVLEKELRAIDFGHRLGWFKTPYSQMVKDRHRTFNLALAAKSLDGQVVMPGDVFSFNDVVGERSEARGYRVAHVIAAGQLVDGMGGGTCQIAGTLHAAAFFAGLDIVKREPHSRPSAYIRVGLDATVSYPNIDLQLRNPFPYPVVLGMRVADGWVTGEVRGPERELTITYVRTMLETKAPPTRTIPDETMPRGLEIVEQRGVPGYTVRRWRIFRKGTVQWRNASTDRYPPTPHVVKVGTNPALERPETPPALPEPVGDACNMKIVQGPNDLFEEQTNCGGSPSPEAEE
jgi:vancomycin resistance protein YoaR